MSDDKLGSLATEVESLLEAKMADFFAFCAKNWGMMDDAAAQEGKPKAWAEGWDAAIESIPDAFKCWIEVGQP